MRSVREHLTSCSCLVWTRHRQFEPDSGVSQDFHQFAELRKKRRLLALSAQAVGGIDGFSKVDFQWAASQVCQVDLSDTAVDIIFYIFDENGDGKLSMSESLGVQDLREIVSVDPLQTGIVHMIKCMWNCAQKSCNSGVYW